MKRKSLFPFLVMFSLLLVASMAIVSCDDSSEKKDKTLSLLSEADLDGSITWLGGDVYSVSTDGDTVNLGDIGNDAGCTRAFISFDVSSFPEGATIKSAVLRIYQNDETNGDPYAGLWDVVVYNIQYTSPEATGSFFNASNYGVDEQTLASSFSANTWHELDVTEDAQSEINDYNTGHLQFLMRHEIEDNNNGAVDDDGWVLGDSDTNQPQLIITY